jgi:uncharacterized protein YecT (DUF1311 family)
MQARLTKPRRRRKTLSQPLLIALLAVLSSTAAADGQGAAALRDCVAGAASAEAVAACEAAHQQRLHRRIEILSDALQERLAPAQRRGLEQNIAAWQAYFGQAVALLDITLKARGDGLAARLRPGLISRLLEQREQQLREHVQNLAY